jgi:MoaA/NifB/PqqE/SkfB family radical SAM enzyme
MPDPILRDLQAGLTPKTPPPDETGLEKILLFPEKLAALCRGELDPLYPVSVELSLTSRCDLNCLWCSERKWRDRSPDRLTISVLEEFFRDLAAGGTRGVTIEGGGEPTISPLFKAAAESAAATGLAVGLITNGLSLFRRLKPDFYRIFQWVRVSLDAYSPESFKRLKGADGFDLALSNLKTLADLNGPAAGVGYVLANVNDDPDELYALAQKLRSIKVAYLHLRPVVDRPELSGGRIPLNVKSLETESFAINDAALFDNQGTGNDGLPCLAHSLAAVVTSDGLVWLCGRQGQSQPAEPIGDLTKSSFKEIWRGQARAHQAETAARGDFCQNACPPCRMTKYNRLISRLKRIKSRDFI